MTLYEMLDNTMADQIVWIFENNAYDQNMPLFKGTVNNARIEPELRVWDFLMCEVEFYDCSHGILDIRVKDKNYDSRLEDHYRFADKWDRYDKSTRPWRYSIEIEEDKRANEIDPPLETDVIVTNADRIRAMKDEELARFLWQAAPYDNCPPMKCIEFETLKKPTTDECIACWGRWLKQEV